MSDEQKSVQHVVVTPTKSVGISLILTILFGPLGLLYSTAVGGLIMIVASIVLPSFTFGLVTLALLITWPISIIWGAVAVSFHNKKLLAQQLAS